MLTSWLSELSEIIWPQLLTVALPEGTALCDLASVLRAGLADLAFDRVARRPDRVRHRYATGRPVVVAPRYSLLTPGDVERVTVAEDLFHFGPGAAPTPAYPDSFPFVLTVPANYPGNTTGDTAPLVVRLHHTGPQEVLMGKPAPPRRAN